MHIPFRENDLTVFGDFHRRAQVVEELKLGNAAHDCIDPEPPAQAFATGGHVNSGRQAHQGRTPGDPFHRQEPGVALGTREKVRLLGGIAGVEPHAHQAHRHATGVGPAFLQHLAQGAPDCISRGVAFEHPVLNEPRMLLPAKAPDGDLDAVLLHVDARSQQQGSIGHGADAVALSPLQQALPFGCLTLLHPGFAELGVFKSLERYR